MNPIAVFKQTWLEAKELKDASASYCTLATISSSHQASVRTLVLREVNDDSFSLFVNETSPKWQDLTNSKKIEILVFWPSLMQQYRIRGNVSELSRSVMEAHWRKKPYGAKIIDHFYAQKQPQSSVIGSRELLLQGIDELKQKYPSGEEIPYPNNARGISLQATYIEHWKNSPADRIHKRHEYRLTEGNWKEFILVP